MAQTVVQDGASVLAEGEDHPLAARDRLVLDGGDQARRLGFVAPACGERQLRDVDPPAAGRVDDGVRLFDQCRGGVERPFEDAQHAEIHEADLQHAERAGVTSDHHMAGGKQMPAVVVEQLRRGPRGKPRPAHVVFRVAALVTKRAQRTLEDCRAFAVLAGQAQGETVEQQIGGARRTRRRRGGASGLGHL